MQRRGAVRAGRWGGAARQHSAAARNKVCMTDDNRFAFTMFTFWNYRLMSKPSSDGFSDDEDNDDAGETH